MLYEGKQVTADPEAGVSWFRRSAEQGDKAGQAFLASALLKGKGARKDIGEALIWLRKAADQEEGWSLYKLALMYRDGRYVERSRAMYENLIRRAAAANWPAAKRLVDALN